MTMIIGSPRRREQLAAIAARMPQRGAKIGIIASGTVDTAALKKQLTDALAKAGIANAEIELDLVDALERHKETGKLRRFIPLPKVAPIP